jgi:hypothetical protein
MAINGVSGGGAPGRRPTIGGRGGNRSGHPNRQHGAMGEEHTGGDSDPNRPPSGKFRGMKKGGLFNPNPTNAGENNEGDASRLGALGEMLGGSDGAQQRRVRALASLDRETILIIEDKLTRAREIENKAIRLEIKVEKLESMEADLLAKEAALDAEREKLQQRLREMQEEIDREIAKKVKDYLAEFDRKMRLKTGDKSALYSSSNEGADEMFLQIQRQYEEKAKQKKVMNNAFNYFFRRYIFLKIVKFIFHLKAIFEARKAEMARRRAERKEAERLAEEERKRKVSLQFIKL